MNGSFLNYYKTILEKVSFDQQLLSKEYQKALKVLEESEVEEFHEWLESSELNEQLMPIKVRS